MKKYIIKLYLAIGVMIGLTGCSDWLDVEQKDKNLEEKQYSTEIGINNVLNGIYVELRSPALYGNNLSKTTIEQLAHYYYVPTEAATNPSSAYLRFYELQNYEYSSTTVKTAFSSIWTSAYKLIFRINIFIKNVETTSVISDAKKKQLLGEAYALRAFIHLDIFRLYGPIYKFRDASSPQLPYNTNDNATEAKTQSPEDFMNMVFMDIELAESLLENDPILDVGILNPNDEEGLSSVEIFGEYARNKRMNIVALKALRARALAVTDRLDDAAAVAQSIINAPGMIEDIDGNNPDALFRWVDPTNITYSKEKDYIFKTEVLFSVHNVDLNSGWATLIGNSSAGSTYSVHQRNIFVNLFDRPEETALRNLSDIRALQWTDAAELSADEFVSIRYSKFNDVEDRNSIKFMQPLMRMTELYYLIIENELNNGNLVAATDLINSLMVRRGYKENELFTTAVTEATLRDFLLREYYREFYAEGQTFFYLKRIASDRIFGSDGKTTFVEMDLYNYIVPIPDAEILN